MISRAQRGFTLVELMVTMGVIVVLATIAYPLYTAQAAKGRRADAKTSLEQLALAEERYYTANGSYAGSVTAMSAQIGAVSRQLYATAVAAGSVAQTPNGYYTLAVSSSSTQAFTATATAGSGQLSSDASCKTLSINQLGQHTATDSSGNDSSSTCW